MVKNIIFDLGNVVLKLKWKLVIERYTNNIEEINLLQNVIFNSQEWLQLDEGTISKPDALEIMISKLPTNLHDICKNITDNWNDALVINDEIINFIIDIRKQGYKTYILSNASLELPGFLKSKKLDQYFDGKIISAEEKLLKPDYRIYDVLLKRFNLNPKECLFLDDRKENIDAAINMGINGYVFDYNNYPQFLKDIEKYNIYVNI